MVVIFLYFTLFVVVHIIAKLFKSEQAGRQFQLVVCFLLLFIFYGFRDIPVLNDTSHYYGFYFQHAHILSYKEESIFAYHITDKFEWGFQVFIHFLIKYISENPYTIIIVSSLGITIGELWFINKYSRDIALTCFFFQIAGLFFTHYCILRQAIAIILFYIAFNAYEKGKLRKYYLLVLIAFLFHYSALFLLILPKTFKIKPTLRNSIIALAVSILIAASIFEILSLLGLRDHPYYQAMIQKGALSLVGMIDFVYLSCILLACFFIQKHSLHNEIENHYFWICVLALCISIVSIVFYPVARFNEYLFPLIILQLIRYVSPSTMGLQNIISLPATRRLLKIVIITIMATKIIGVNTFRPEWLHIVPYHFYDFSKDYHTYNLYPY